MEVVVCDAGECAEVAIYYVKVLEGDWKGVEFDACSVEHIGAYLSEIKETVVVG